MKIWTLRHLRDHLNDLIDGELGKLYNVGDMPVGIEPDDTHRFPLTVLLHDPQELEGYATIAYERG